jgi:hypothetical protein
VSEGTLKTGAKNPTPRLARVVVAKRLRTTGFITPKNLHPNPKNPTAPVEYPSPSELLRKIVRG